MLIGHSTGKVAVANGSVVCHLAGKRTILNCAIIGHFAGKRTIVNCALIGHFTSYGTAVGVQGSVVFNGNVQGTTRTTVNQCQITMIDDFLFGVFSSNLLARQINSNCNVLGDGQCILHVVRCHIALEFELSIPMRFVLNRF